MRIWLALLVAPTLALTDESISYAAAGWTCARQDAFVMHAIHALFLAGTIAAVVLAWRLWAETGGDAPAGDERTASRHFLAGLGIAVATLSSAVIAAMWIPNWLLSPCFS
jgi:hypothetical protein